MALGVKYHPQDYNKAWLDKDVKLCKEIGKAMLLAIAKAGPADSRWRNQMLGWVKKLDAVADDDPASLVLDEVRIIILTHWMY